jgi:hypothetical protein
MVRLDFGTGVGVEGVCRYPNWDEKMLPTDVVNVPVVCRYPVVFRMKLLVYCYASIGN